MQMKVRVANWDGVAAGTVDVGVPTLRPYHPLHSRHPLEPKATVRHWAAETAPLSLTSIGRTYDPLGRRRLLGPRPYPTQTKLRTRSFGNPALSYESRSPGPNEVSTEVCPSGGRMGLPIRRRAGHPLVGGFPGCSFVPLPRRTGAGACPAP